MKEVFRKAERGTRDDVSRLILRVPSLLREAARRRAEPADPFAWMLPRLAVATAAAVVFAGAIVLWDRSATKETPFESLILGNETSTGDVLFDALLGAERSDG